MKLLFLNLSGLKFTVATPDSEPLGGSESCLCYLARQLARNGHDVTLIAHLPPGTPDSVMGVKHRPAALIKDMNFFADEGFDAIIASNAPIAIPHLRAVSPNSLIFLWNHVDPGQASMRELGNPEVQQALDGVVYVSEWQKEATRRAFGAAKRAAIIGNGLTPSFENMFASPAELLAAKQNRAAYTSTPYRGLELLLDVMEGLEADITLDIFSSMRVYQAADDSYAGLYQKAQSNPRIRYHGSVTHGALAAQLKGAAFLAYPSVFAETYCIAALEAMAAGMKVIATDSGALATTTMGFADLMPIQPGGSRESFINMFRDLLTRNIDAFRDGPELWAEKMFDQVRRVNKECLWPHRAKAWEELLSSHPQK